MGCYDRRQVFIRSLAIGLSEIFAWTVDFFGLQKGDNFKVIYEELYIDDKLLGTGKIYGAQFSRTGSAVTAIPFIQDGKESYFDTDGTSLRKAFLKAPLQFSRITSQFLIKPYASYSENKKATFWS